MKYTCLALAVLLFTGIAGAQNKMPSPVPANHPDSVMQGKSDAESQQGQHGWFHHKTMCCQQEKMACCQNGIENKESCMSGQNENGSRFYMMNNEKWQHGRFMNFMARPHHHNCLFHCILLLFVGIINILLTIIVALDMARNKCFNGVWIPLMLLAGIPCSLIYALFRIGDRIQLAVSATKA